MWVDVWLHWIIILILWISIRMLELSSFVVCCLQISFSRNLWCFGGYLEECDHGTSSPPIVSPSNFFGYIKSSKRKPGSLLSQLCTSPMGSSSHPLKCISPDGTIALIVFLLRHLKKIEEIFYMMRRTSELKKTRESGWYRRLSRGFSWWNCHLLFILCVIWKTKVTFSMKKRMSEQKKKRESGLYRQLSRGVCECYTIFELFMKISTKLF